MKCQQTMFATETLRMTTMEVHSNDGNMKSLTENVKIEHLVLRTPDSSSKLNRIMAGNPKDVLKNF